MPTRLGVSSRGSARPTCGLIQATSTIGTSKKRKSISFQESERHGFKYVRLPCHNQTCTFPRGTHPTDTLSTEGRCNRAPFYPPLSRCNIPLKIFLELFYLVSGASLDLTPSPVGPRSSTPSTYGFPSFKTNRNRRCRRVAASPKTQATHAICCAEPVEPVHSFVLQSFNCCIRLDRRPQVPDNPKSTGTVVRP